MMKEFRKIDLTQTKIYLVEALPCILSAYPKQLSLKAKSDLEALGVEVLVNTKVEEITNEGVRIGDSFISAKNVIWAAGNSAAPVLKSLGVPLDRAGRVTVQKDMSLPANENIFVIGDAARLEDPQGYPLPGVAQVAIQQGKYVAGIIANDRKQEERKPFIYNDRGSLATIGRAKAVAEIRSVRLSGYLAWLIWTFIHIYFLIGFRNRLRVMFEWIYHYITFKSAARLITKHPQT
jgi:NADH dehydrogenase